MLKIRLWQSLPNNRNSRQQLWVTLFPLLKIKLAISCPHWGLNFSSQSSTVFVSAIWERVIAKHLFQTLVLLLATEARVTLGCMLPESGWWKVHDMVYPTTWDPRNNYLWRFRFRKWSRLFPVLTEGCNGFYLHPRSVPLMLGLRTVRMRIIPKSKTTKVEYMSSAAIMLVKMSQFSIYGVMIPWIELSFKKVPIYKVRGQYKIGYELIEHPNIIVVKQSIIEVMLALYCQFWN